MGSDGSFGSKTDEALRQYQKDHNLKVDGKAGPQTKESMGISDSANTEQKVKVTPTPVPPKATPTPKPPKLPKDSNIVVEQNNASDQANADALVTAAENEYNEMYGWHEKVIGYDKEGDPIGDNNTKYGEWYDSNPNPWCAMFVSYCADQADIPDIVVPKNASTRSMASDYDEEGRLSTNDNYLPKAGDVIFYSSNNTIKGINHTGIVIAYEVIGNKSYVYTIEGNTGNGEVGVKKVELDSKRGNEIYGYGMNGGESYGVVPVYDKKKDKWIF